MPCHNQGQVIVQEELPCVCSPSTITHFSACYLPCPCYDCKKQNSRITFVPPNARILRFAVQTFPCSRLTTRQLQSMHDAACSDDQKLRYILDEAKQLTIILPTDDDLLIHILFKTEFDILKYSAAAENLCYFGLFGKSAII